jgi:PAS domain S-box-containing protein
MHYLGMAAIQVPARMSYHPSLVVLSVAIAISASCAALWLAFRFRRAETRGQLWGKAASAVVMGLAIAGMHYTGMAAAHFGPVEAGLMAPEHDLVATPVLSAAVIAAACLILGIALAGATIDRRMQHKKLEVKRLASVVDATTDYVGTADAQGRFLYLNRAGRAMLGIGADEDMSAMTMMDIYPPRLRETLMKEQIPQAMRDGSWSGETAFLHRSGREVPISLVGLVHRSPTGEVEFLSAVARDISEQVAVREALREARDAAARSAAATSAFLANMSHEIRTPMNGILGMAELLLDTDMTPEQQRSVEVITSSGEALLTVINDVLDLSKIEAGFLALEEVSFDLPSIADAVVRLLATRGFERESSWPRCAPRGPATSSGRPDACAGADQPRGNAIKFTPGVRWSFRSRWSAAPTPRRWSSSRCGTPGSAFPRSRCGGSSSPSARRMRRPPGSTVAPVSACRLGGWWNDGR